MIGKNRIKLINSLRYAKFRDKYNLFVAEGEKIVIDLINSHLKINSLISTSAGLEIIDKFTVNSEIIEVSENELKKISYLSTPNKLLAIAEIPQNSFSADEISDSLSLALEDLQDPGNFGTIIRTADWFGISNIFCSENCVDAFNPKVVQSAMGANFRVNIHYVDVFDFTNNLLLNNGFSVYGTFLDGKNIYTHPLSRNGIIFMGNESKGISKGLESLITERLHIPGFSKNISRSESLNVSSATAIVCSEFKRRGF